MSVQYHGPPGEGGRERQLEVENRQLRIENKVLLKAFSEALEDLKDWRAYYEIDPDDDATTPAGVIQNQQRQIRALRDVVQRLTEDLDKAHIAAAAKAAVPEAPNY